MSATKYFNCESYEQDAVIVENIVIDCIEKDELCKKILPIQYDSIYIDGIKSDMQSTNEEMFRNKTVQVQVFYKNIIVGREDYLNKLEIKYNGLNDISKVNNYATAKTVLSQFALGILTPALLINDGSTDALLLFLQLYSIIITIVLIILL